MIIVKNLVFILHHLRVIINLQDILIFYKSIVILMKIKIIYFNYKKDNYHLKAGNGMKIIKRYIYFYIIFL